MFDPAKRALTPQETGLLDAGQWAGQVSRDYKDHPEAVSDYLRGFVSGIVHFLGQVDGHGKTGDFAKRCGDQQIALQSYDDAARVRAKLPTLKPALPRVSNGGAIGGLDAPNVAVFPIVKRSQP